MNIDLQKSIQLLDDAVSPTVNRRTPRGAFRHSRYTPNKAERFSASQDTFMATPSKPSLLTQDYSFQTKDLSQIVTGLNRTENLEFTATELDMTEDLTQTNMSFMVGEDPGLKASSGLYEDFQSAMKKWSSPHQAMELLSAYSSSCGQQVRTLKKLQKGVTRNQPKLKRTVTTIDLLRGELETWQLIKSLYKDRLESETADESMDHTEQDVYTKVWSLSEKNIINHLYEKDSVIRQSQLIIDWLETCAAEDLDTFSDNAKFFVDQPVFWENTLHQLQSMKKGLRSSRERPTVSEMDPDAPIRQKKSLDDLDKEDERFFMKNLFWCLRAGKLDMASELCHRCGQTWRAATLEGWRLHHDPRYYNTNPLSDSNENSVQGNAYRDVWKSVCWRMASESDMEKYERALYAALSGNLEALLPVCMSWMDFVWAYYKVMVDIRVEQDIRLHHHVTRTLDTLPAEYWDKMFEPQEIFKEIGASVHENIRQQAQHWYHVIQKFIILGDIPALIETMYSWLQEDRDYPPQHLLRLMVHVVLFLRSIGHACKEDLCESIIEAYVTYLIKSKHKSLVAHYVSMLKLDSQVQWYASFLEGIDDTSERRECLQLAEVESLDVAAITKAVVERVRSTNTLPPPENSLAPDISISAEDQSKIDAIDWLVFDDTHRSEAMKQGNAIMRSFIAVKKHLAARKAFEKLPIDSIDVIYRQWHHKTANGDEELPADEANAIREYLCMKAYLDAVESFNDWFTLYHQGQPMRPAGCEDTASFTDRVAMEHQMKQYQQEYDRWRHNLLQQTKVTRDRIYNVLLFADGGWLVDTVEVTSTDLGRQHQLTSLRRLHLPSLCLSLHTVLHTSQLYTEAVQIADVIASEHNKLYQDFDPESLQQLLSQIARSSRCLLDNNKDPLGYEVV